MILKHLTDEQLLKDTEAWVRKERGAVTCVLYHLREVERRRVFADLGYPSLFEYAVKKLGYSEGSAMRRIHSARLLAENPDLAEKISQGMVSLSNLASAANLFKRENIRNQEKRREILRAIEMKSSRECERVLNHFSSSSMEKLLYLQFKVKEPTFNKFQELKGYLAPKTLVDDELVDLLVSRTIEHVKFTKFRHTAPPAPEAHSKTRYIPVQVRGEVFNRDEGKCRNCGSKYRLEYDHQRPFSHGGETSSQNLRLLCHSCNERARYRSRL